MKFEGEKMPNFKTCPVCGLSHNYNMANDLCISCMITGKKKTPKVVYPSILAIPNTATTEQVNNYLAAHTAYNPFVKKTKKENNVPSPFRTQKAKGYSVLSSNGWHVPNFRVAQRIGEVEDLYRSLQLSTGTKADVFVRPCPVRPRHGFVDSRSARDCFDAIEIYIAALRADPEAELLLTIKQESAYNVVWRPGLIAIGPGHDGATAGDNCVDIPLVAHPTILASLQKEGGIADGEAPYIEAVIPEDKTKQRTKMRTPVYTQLRGGPAMEFFGTDYVPHEMTVEHVVDARGDLLEWERLAAKFKPNTAVWHPSGSMASHYSIHCVLNKIPVIISAKPKIGDVLQPTNKIEAPSPISVRAGVAAGSAVPIPRGLYPAAVCTILTGLHNVTALGGEKGFYIGVAAAVMYRLGLAASLGEARHADHTFGGERLQIYDKAIKAVFGHRKKMELAQQLFQYHLWGGGFGGKKWAKCGRSIFGLDMAMKNIVKKPNLKNMNELINRLNKAVNQAHHNGWWLNKFADATFFDLAAKGHPRAVVPAAPLLFSVSRLKASTVQAKLANWQNCKPLSIQGPPVHVKKKGKKGKPAKSPAHAEISFVQVRIVNHLEIRLQVQYADSLDHMKEHTIITSPEIIEELQTLNCDRQSLAKTKMMYALVPHKTEGTTTQIFTPLSKLLMTLEWNQSYGGHTTFGAKLSDEDTSSDDDDDDVATIEELHGGDGDGEGQDE